MARQKETIAGLYLVVLLLAPIAVDWWPWWASLALAIASGAVWVLVRDHL